jgi:two-component system chemotaxis response regulator CheY
VVLKNLSYLVVDDNLSIRNLVSATLTNKIGAKNVQTAANGAQALKILNQDKVDIVISDWEMPIMDGQQLLKELRASAKFKNLPFIMMTTKGGKESVVEAIQSGVTHYIVKPFSVDKLEDTIRKSWNVTALRRSDRVSNIPEHQVVVQIDEQFVSGQIGDISLSGTMLELPFDPVLHLFKEGKLLINVVMNAHESIRITGLVGHIIRMDTDVDCLQEKSRCRVAIHFDEDANRGRADRMLGILMNKLLAAMPSKVG